MRIEHIAIYTQDLEGMRNFFETYFHAQSNQLYHNQKTSFKSYFLTFEDGARLEIMTRDDVVDKPSQLNHLGLIHLAFSLGSEEVVNELTERLVAADYPLLSGPRVTGDGYYESCVLGFEGVQIELTV
ncbi:TPA: VOC family protein [Streptococcus suis]|uniref:VOC family protein n=1 Tax=Streptococcus suis TaxID=1307 RepID=UPI00209AC2A8|nr:VOC family protein [Streptococcus suis]MCO8173608.1 VOC family protein [Streptococcus suis]MCO8181934.1 VOC family protein [Streptococcus suis]HEL1649774.1 VOC family protein [Streptococcus suis]HEM3531135.1 VOC family protein [Streptococcus suis]HEM3535683.1 VOC family protein [Streptococcus suis]